MSRATVRSAVAAWFSPPNVAGLNYVYSAWPKKIDGEKFRSGSGQPSGAVGVVHINAESEQRIGMGGPFAGQFIGRKIVTYDVSLNVRVHSVELRLEDAMAFYDQVFDAAKARIRSDQSLGQGIAVIFQAGETTLTGEHGEPEVMSDGATAIWGRLNFTVEEVITA